MDLHCQTLFSPISSDESNVLEIVESTPPLVNSPEITISNHVPPPTFPNHIINSVNKRESLHKTDSPEEKDNSSKKVDGTDDVSSTQNSAESFSVIEGLNDYAREMKILENRIIENDRFLANFDFGEESSGSNPENLKIPCSDSESPERTTIISSTAPVFRGKRVSTFNRVKTPISKYSKLSFNKTSSQRVTSTLNKLSFNKTSSHPSNRVPFSSKLPQSTSIPVSKPSKQVLQSGVKTDLKLPLPCPMNTIFSPLNTLNLQQTHALRLLPVDDSTCSFIESLKGLQPLLANYRVKGSNCQYTDVPSDPTVQVGFCLSQRDLEYLDPGFIHSIENIRHKTCYMGRIFYNYKKRLVPHYSTDLDNVILHLYSTTNLTSKTCDKFSKLCNFEFLIHNALTRQQSTIPISNFLLRHYHTSLAYPSYNSPRSFSYLATMMDRCISPQLTHLVRLGFGSTISDFSRCQDSTVIDSRPVIPQVQPQVGKAVHSYQSEALEKLYDEQYGVNFIHNQLVTQPNSYVTRELLKTTTRVIYSQSQSLQVIHNPPGPLSMHARVGQRIDHAIRCKTQAISFQTSSYTRRWGELEDADKSILVFVPCPAIHDNVAETEYRALCCAWRYFVIYFHLFSLCMVYVTYPKCLYAVNIKLSSYVGFSVPGGGTFMFNRSQLLVMTRALLSFSVLNNPVFQTDADAIAVLHSISKTTQYTHYLSVELSLINFLFRTFNVNQSGVLSTTFALVFWGDSSKCPQLRCKLCALCGFGHIMLSFNNFLK